MRFRFIRSAALVVMLFPAACMQAEMSGASPNGAPSATAQAALLPAMRWDDRRPEAEEWTEATLAALRAHGAVLTETVPSDIGNYCPHYAKASEPERRAFWAGLLSALAKHESTWNPAAKGGGGKWIGLLQIAPRTAAAYDCDLPKGKGLTDGSTNLACAVRIAAVQVGRDGVIAKQGSGRIGGIARDWAPMRVAAKRDDVADWTRAQSYCQG